MRVTLYSKPDCPLCEEALALLQSLILRYDLQISSVDIMGDEALYEAYGDKAPVAEIEDGTLGRLQAPIDEAQLRVHLEIARRSLMQAEGASRHRGAQEPSVDRAVGHVGRHWLRFASIALASFVGLPWLAPIFAWLGWWGLADPIYTAYAVT